MAKLRIIPLGGLGEVGKNMTAFEFGDDIVVVDCGSIFPRADMLGIDLVIPDITYLERNRERVRAYLNGTCERIEELEGEVLLTKRRSSPISPYTNINVWRHYVTACIL